PIDATERSEATARPGGMDARKLEQAADGASARETGGHESAQFRPHLYQGDACHTREVCRAFARRDRAQAAGRDPAQLEADCRRLRIRKRQIDARSISADVEDCAAGISAAFSRRERRSRCIRTVGRRTGMRTPQHELDHLDGVLLTDRMIPEWGVVARE